MKNFFAILFLVILTIATVSCSSRPRQPRVASSSTGLSYHSQQAAAGTAKVNSEPMKIWINPIEYSLEKNDEIGNDGAIEEYWEDTNTFTTVRQGVDANAQLLAQGVQFRDSRVSFDTLSGSAQRAILSIMKKYGIDGIFITMIDEFTGTLKQEQQTIAKYKTKDGQVKKDARITTKAKTIVFIKGIALRLKYVGPVSPERADEVRKAPTINIFN